MQISRSFEALRSTEARLELATVAGGRKDGSQDSEAFSREALTYTDHLYRVAFNLARDAETARDLVQETYARALRASVQFAPGTNMKAWLTRILHNFFLDDYYRKKKWVSLESANAPRPGDAEIEHRQPVAECAGPEEQFLNKELSEQIRDALARIPEEFRSVVVLVDMADLSYAEAANVLDCPVGTVRSRLSRGRRHLLKQLKSYVRID